MIMRILRAYGDTFGDLCHGAQPGHSLPGAITRPDAPGWGEVSKRALAMYRMSHER
jgi:hypothetical protein